MVLSSNDDVRLQGGALAVRSGEGSSVPLQRKHEATNVETGNSKTSGDVQVLVRTSPGAEYVKVTSRVQCWVLIACLWCRAVFPQSSRLRLADGNTSQYGLYLQA